MEDNMPLTIAPTGTTLKIIKLLVDDKTKRHLENLGLLIGAEIINLYQSAGDIILKIKDGRIAINKSLALKIFVA